MSKFIGVLRSRTTGRILAVINPSMDQELDNPRHLLLKTGEEGELIEMIKVDRGEYMGLMTTDQLFELVERLSRETRDGV